MSIISFLVNKQKLMLTVTYHNSKNKCIFFGLNIYKKLAWSASISSKQFLGIQISALKQLHEWKKNNLFDKLSKKQTYPKNTFANRKLIAEITFNSKLQKSNWCQNSDSRT